MVDSSWDGETPAARDRRLPVWSRWLLAAILVPVALGSLLGLLLGSQALGNRNRVWPLVQAVSRELASDEGARRIYRDNPEMADLYSSEAAFLAELQADRPLLAALPAQEPAEGSERYQPASNPGGLGCTLRLDDSHWFEVEVDNGGPFHLDGNTQVRILLAPTRAGLHSLAEKPWEAALAVHWQELRKVAEAFGSDEGARRLLEGSPELKKSFKDPEAFLRLAQRWRDSGLTLPASAKEAKGRVRASSRRVFTYRVDQLGYRAEGGAGLRLTWRAGKLADLTVFRGKA